MTERHPTPSRDDLKDRAFVGGYLSELAAHQLAAGPFKPTLQDVRVMNAAATLLQSERKPIMPEAAEELPPCDFCVHKDAATNASVGPRATDAT